MAGPAQGVLAGALLKGRSALGAIESPEVLRNRQEWEDLYVVGSALVEDLYLEGVDGVILAHLRAALAGFGLLVRNSQEQVPEDVGELRRILQKFAGGQVSKIPPDKFERAVARTRRTMSLFGTSAATMAQLRAELERRRGKERPIGYIGDAGLIHWTVDKARTPGKALLSILEHPRTKEILEALQPESSQLGNKEVVFQLDNGVTFKIRAIAGVDGSDVGIQPFKLFVEIGLNLNGISKDQWKEAERRFARLRMEIFRVFSSSERLDTLAAAEGMVLENNIEAVRVAAGLTLAIENGPSSSFLRIDLRGEQQRDYRGWLSHFLGFFLREGVWTFRP